MKTKHVKSLLFITSLIVSFFLGRESKHTNFENTIRANHSIIEYAPLELDPKNDFFNTIREFNQKETDTVYRCGQSKIYHPTTSHGSFKRCRSIVYKLTLERAQNLGLRHCKCNY